MVEVDQVLPWWVELSPEKRQEAFLSYVDKGPIFCDKPGRGYPEAVIVKQRVVPERLLYVASYLWEDTKMIDTRRIYFAPENEEGQFIDILNIGFPGRRGVNNGLNIYMADWPGEFSYSRLSMRIYLGDPSRPDNRSVHDLHNSSLVINAQEQQLDINYMGDIADKITLTIGIEPETKKYLFFDLGKIYQEGAVKQRVGKVEFSLEYNSSEDNILITTEDGQKLLLVKRTISTPSILREKFPRSRFSEPFDSTPSDDFSWIGTDWRNVFGLEWNPEALI